jgi:hypothetical protein
VSFTRTGKILRRPWGISEFFWLDPVDGSPPTNFPGPGTKLIDANFFPGERLVAAIFFHLPIGEKRPGIVANPIPAVGIEPTRGLLPRGF